MIEGLQKLHPKQRDDLLSRLLSSLGASSSSSSSSSSPPVRIRRKLRIRKSEEKKKRRLSRITSPIPAQGGKDSVESSALVTANEESLKDSVDSPAPVTANEECLKGSVESPAPPVTANEECLAPVPPKNPMRCPFFFSIYGCFHGDDCNFRHFAPTSNDKYRNDRDGFNTMKFAKVSPIPRSNDNDVPAPSFPPSEWGVTVTLIMDVKAYWVNRAIEACLKQMEKSFSVEILIKDHGSNTDLKSVAIIGTLNQATKAFREICKLESRDSSYYGMLLGTEPALYTTMQELDNEDSQIQQRWPGQSVFRVLVPRAMDIEACLEGFKSNNVASLEMIKGNAQTIALVYAKEERCCCRSAAIEGLMWLFSFFVISCKYLNPGGKFAMELLVEKEQAYQFFQRRAEIIERICGCTFAIHETDGIGLQRDLILEVIEGVGDLREALSETACFFQRFSVHHSMIPVMKVLMDGSQMDYRSCELSADSHLLSGHLVKMIEYTVESYYVADALVGENGAVLQKIRNDSNTLISLGELELDPGNLMIFVMEIDSGVREAEKIIENLLNNAVTRTRELVFACKATYRQKR